MPELPEVETIRRQLAPRLTGRTVVEADSHGSDKFRPAREIAGAEFTGTGRRGKYLLIDLDHPAAGEPGRQLIVHLGMTGALSFAGADDPIGDHVRAHWLLDDNNRLLFTDVRRFGRLRVVATGEYDDIPTLAAMGPEPFDPAFTADHLWRALRNSDRMVKTQLLSQRPVAGVGNIYADEALFLAGIDPAARRVSRERAARLRDRIEEVLTHGLQRGGTTLRDYRTVDGAAGENQFHLVCYGRADEPCVRCGEPLRRKVLDARTTTWCPICQRC
ncbi:MAG: bifunctional DNA-formamidopyrimidine glycosylase/DNA-(apurinic or apyrimidinic site) lyase [Actinomycetia bacterium]|nr:bifunctional DNA-formamidopyrimidine glycosylase/DNA-(apurinic or apyrimidinic site) lyase [Actinomycetes bacterium]